MSEASTTTGRRRRDFVTLGHRRIESLESRQLMSAVPLTADPTTANSAFVEAVYQDILGRPADAAGLAWAVGQINAGQGRAGFVDALVYSDEAHADFIRSIYQQYLGREADAPGLTYWLQQLHAGVSNQAVQAAILGSDEFYARAGGNTSDWIEAVYPAVLGRPVDAPAMSWATSQISSGVGLDEMATMLLDSAEGATKIVEQELSQFQAPLDAGNVPVFANELATQQITEQELATAYLSSPQYYESQTGVPTTIVPVPDAQPQALRDVATISAQAAQGNATTVFVGDSITAYWQTRGAASWNDGLAPLGSFDAGIAGDMTENVLWRLDQGNLRGISPNLAVVMIGINDLARGSSPADVAAGVTAVVRTLQSEFPAAKILLLGILPAGQLAASMPLRQEIVATNELLAPLADGQHIWFLDLGADFLNPGGTLNQNLFQPDLVHPSPMGYQILTNAVAPWVRVLAS